MPSILIVTGLIVLGLAVRTGTRYYELKQGPPLLDAVVHATLYDVERALRLGANPNQRHEDGRPLLHHAVKLNNLRIVELLLSHGADPNLLDSKGVSPMDIAIPGRYSSAIILALRNHGARYTAFEATVIGDLESLRKFLSQDPGLVAKMYQSNFLSPKTLLNIAIGGSKFDAARLLLEYGADINSLNQDGQTAFMEAASQSDCPEELLDFMLEQGPRLDLRDYAGQTLIHAVAASCRMERLEKFLEFGLDVNAQDVNGTSPLAQVVSRCDAPQLLELLIQHGARDEVKTIDGGTLLHLAAQSSNAEMVAHLISNGFDVNARDSTERTPLALPWWDFIAQLLLEHGADVNAVDIDGNTPLHHALYRAAYGHVDILLKWGADIHAVNNDGLSPLEIATPKMAATLRESQKPEPDA